ncbi:MAG: glycosyl hydrolase [Planctomycetota bacterium]
MYASHGFLRSDIGDVDVLYHDGRFHLFHLVLPNHDFIAHAVSDDGLSWSRVKNAMFVGEPGSWDDDMLWTMHVSPDPERDGRWRMFYTGLSRREYGRVQRVGVATSGDLLNWEKVEGNGYPLEVEGGHYEADVDACRKWVSFRDPYFFVDPATGKRWLLAACRVDRGPMIRRGCVGLAEEVLPGHFEFREPLHHPGLYDDVEVPNVFTLDGKYFLLGSIREDVKVHYWTAESFVGPYGNFFDNVLLPKGNYAARVCRAGDDLLLFNFFQKTEQHFGRDISKKLLPPPKALVTDETGRLRLRSYRKGFDGVVSEDCALSLDCSNPQQGLDRLFDNPHAVATGDADEMHLGCASGYEAFLLPGGYESFRLRAQLGLEGSGKCGMVLRVDDQGDGYYLSLDLFKGVAQLRAWGVNDGAELDHAFRYRQLQAGYFVSRDDGPWDLEVVAHGMYLEVSINGYVILSLVDETFGQGRIGFYTESAKVVVRGVTLQRLDPPRQEQPSGPIYTSGVSQPVPDLEAVDVSDPSVGGV